MRLVCGMLGIYNKWVNLVGSNVELKERFMALVIVTQYDIWFSLIRSSLSHVCKILDYQIPKC